RERAPCPALDVLDQVRPGSRPVAAPELVTVHAVVTAEVEPAVPDGQAGSRGSVARTPVDVRDPLRTGRRTVGPPQLEPVRAVVGDDVRRARQGRVRPDGLPQRRDEDRAGPGTVATPQLHLARAVRL